MQVGLPQLKADFMSGTRGDLELPLSDGTKEWFPGERKSDLRRRPALERGAAVFDQLKLDQLLFHHLAATV